MSGDEFVGLYDQYRSEYADGTSANLTFYVFGLNDMSLAVLRELAFNSAPEAAAAVQQKYADCLLNLAGGSTPVEAFYGWLKETTHGRERSAGVLWTHFIEERCGVRVNAPAP